MPGEKSKVRLKHVDAITKEIAALRGWLDYLERDISSDGVIHAVLLTSINESCMKLIYNGGVLNGELLSRDEHR